MQHLGVILAPFGKNGPGWYAESGPAYGGKGTYLQPARPYPTTDRFFNTRGEVGLYYDTQLGMIPTDAELAKTYSCYTPVASGWINAKEGFVPSPWRFGWDPAGKYGPQTSLSGLGAEALPASASAVDVIAVMNAHNRKVFWLSAISTAAVSISALFTLYRTKRLLDKEFSARKARKAARK